MKKLSLLILSLFFLSNFIYSQDVKRTGGYARFLSMGNNPYLVDPEGIKVNPAWASVYNNFIWGDIGSNAGDAFGNSSSGQFVGFNFSLNRRFTLGAMLTRNDFNTLSIGQLDPLASLGADFGVMNQVPNTVRLNNNLEIFSSLNAGMITFGLGIAYAASKNNTKPSTGGETTISASQFGINGGVLVNLNRNLILDAGISMIFPGASNEPPAGFKTEASQTIIGLNGRLFWQYSERVRFIPSFYFVGASGSVERGGSTGDLNSLSSIGIGFGVEYSTEDFLLVGGPGLNINSWTIPGIPNAQQELSNSSFIFPVWNLGAEWYAIDWLVARIGYTASTSSNTTQTPEGANAVRENTITQYVPGHFTLGVGFRFGHFSLDATVNDDVLRQGLGNIGGGPTFAYISASYGF